MRRYVRCVRAVFSSHTSCGCHGRDRFVSRVVVHEVVRVRANASMSRRPGPVACRPRPFARRPL
eukprot:15478709-Alexandrium_andersonii.AAC.1